MHGSLGENLEVNIRRGRSRAPAGRTANSIRVGDVVEIIFLGCVRFDVNDFQEDEVMWKRR
jgi:hypothetical protein